MDNSQHLRSSPPSLLRPRFKRALSTFWCFPHHTIVRQHQNIKTLHNPCGSGKSMMSLHFVSNSTSAKLGLTTLSSQREVEVEVQALVHGRIIGARLDVDKSICLSNPFRQSLCGGYSSRGWRDISRGRGKIILWESNALYRNIRVRAAIVCWRVHAATTILSGLRLED